MGPLLDWEIAETVMGWEAGVNASSGQPCWKDDVGWRHDLPHFSTDMTAAVSAVRHAMKGRTHWTMRFVYSDKGMFCEITIPSYEYSAFADTEAEAMCKAILKFVEDKR